MVASSTVGGVSIASNDAQVTWDAGQDVTFLTLNPSPKGGIPGNPVTITASLSDISKNPAVPVIGQSVTLGMGNDTCGASTDSSGLASCTISSPQVIPGEPARQLMATYAGNSNLVASSASTGFLFSAPLESAKLVVTPKTLNFPGEVELGGIGVTSKPKPINVFNPKTKKQDLTVTFLGAGNSGDFAIVNGAPTTCNATLAPKSKCVIGVTFSPTASGKRTGVLMISDNADLNAVQTVKLKGVGKQGKLTYEPHSIGFANETVSSTSAPKTINVTNRNPLPMPFDAAISGDYAISSNTCASTLAADAKCAIGVTFTPTMTGVRTGSLTFTDTAVGSPQTVKLSGTSK